jgi:hypothetical protein
VKVAPAPAPAPKKEEVKIDKVGSLHESANPHCCSSLSLIPLSLSVR